MADDPSPRAARPWDLLNRKIGRVDGSVAAQRLRLCHACPRFIKLTRQCSECGCFMAAKVKLPNASCPVGTWDRSDSATTDDAHPAASAVPTHPEPTDLEQTDLEPTQPEAGPLKSVLFVLDDEVVHSMHVDERLAAILLSNPVIVEPPRSASGTPLRTGDYYFPDGTTVVTRATPATSLSEGAGAS
jgi:hypothetical protein